MLTQKQWFWKRRARLYIGSNELEGSLSKVKGSIFAILFGLIIGSLVIIGTGNNFITYFQYILLYDFSSYGGLNNWDTTLLWWALYVVAGLTLVMSFKTGMFNIGVPGQLLAAGAVILTIGIRYNLSQPLMLLFAFVCGVLAAMLVAGVIVVLKVLFNVHEVVTSILLNWTIWYFVKWIFTTTKDLYNADSGSSAPVHDQGLTLGIDGYKFIIPLILAIVLVYVVWFLLKRTSLGYKFKTVGLNPFAAQYAGISNKKYAFFSFIISGALAGVMAFIYYVGLNPSISFANDDLPTLGFDAISVALVGQISAIGVIGSALLWGIIKAGEQIGSTGLDIPQAVGDIIFGVIIYSAACAVLLSKLQPIKFLIRNINLNFNKSKRQIADQYLVNIWNNFIKTFKIKKTANKEIKELKQIIRLKQKNQSPEQEVLPLKTQLNELLHNKGDDVEVCWSQIHQNYKSYLHYSHKEYKKLWLYGLLGIRNDIVKTKKELYGESLNQYIKLRSNYEESIFNDKKALDNKIVLVLKNDAPSTRKTKVATLKNEYESQIKTAKLKFNNEFSQLLKGETQTLNQIKAEWKTRCKTYQANLATAKVVYKADLKAITTEYDNEINRFKDDKTKLKELKTNYKTKVLELKTKYQNSKLQPKVGGEE